LNLKIKIKKISLEKKTTILIAEDEDDLRKMYDMALTDAGFKVVEAKNGREALEFLNKEYKSVDLVLLDIVMPETNGLEALAQIRKTEAYKNIPVIISTNLDNEEDKSNAYSLGIKGYFIKSRYTPKDLVQLVQALLGDSQK